MNHTRLRFAASRGARIEALCKGGKRPTWIKTSVILDDDSCYEVRAHPEDEYLQYGPLSSKLREYALIGHDVPNTVELSAALLMWNLEYSNAVDDVYERPFASNDEAYFGMLFFAEYLADQGL